jgi:hypothetical protein
MEQWVNILGTSVEFLIGAGSKDEIVHRVMDKLSEKDSEISRLRYAFGKESHEVEQILGQALGYLWYKDDQKNFPGATEKDGVCVGEHIPQTLAMEAVHEIARLNAIVDDIAKYIDWSRMPSDLLARIRERKDMKAYVEQEAHDE